MVGRFNSCDRWNDLTNCTAVPLACLQSSWEQDKVYTQNHFSRGHVVVACLFQGVKLQSTKYIATAFSPKLWINRTNNDSASTDEFQTYRFQLLDDPENIDRFSKLQTWTPIFIKCSLDKIYSDNTVAFRDAELLVDYKASANNFAVLPNMNTRLMQTKTIDTFVKLVSSFTNWNKDECLALYYCAHKEGQPLSAAASNISATLTQKETKSTL